jgi:hypothetical protein
LSLSEDARFAQMLPSYRRSEPSRKESTTSQNSPSETTSLITTSLPVSVLPTVKALPLPLSLLLLRNDFAKNLLPIRLVSLLSAGSVPVSPLDVLNTRSTNWAMSSAQYCIASKTTLVRWTWTEGMSALTTRVGCAAEVDVVDWCEGFMVLIDSRGSNGGAGGSMPLLAMVGAAPNEGSLSGLAAAASSGPIDKLAVALNSPAIEQATTTRWKATEARIPSMESVFGKAGIPP